MLARGSVSGSFVNKGNALVLHIIRPVAYNGPRDAHRHRLQEPAQGEISFLSHSLVYSLQVDPTGTCDPYVVIKCADASADATKVHFETPGLTNTVNPVFSCSFDVQNVSRRAVFHISVMDRDLTSANDVVGEVELAIWCATQGVEKEVWLTLAKPCGTAAAPMRGVIGIRFVTHDFGEAVPIEGDEVQSSPSPPSPPPLLRFFCARSFSSHPLPLPGR